MVIVSMKQISGTAPLCIIFKAILFHVRDGMDSLLMDLVYWAISGTCLQTCMLMPYGQATKTQKTAATSRLAKLRSTVPKIRLYNVNPCKEVSFHPWGTFSRSVRITVKTSLLSPMVEFTELSVLVAAITLAQRKTLRLVRAQVLLRVLPARMQLGWLILITV